MSSPALRFGIVGCAICLAACATETQTYYENDGSESAPVGTHIKPTDGYRRGGSSFSVKVIGRKQLEQRSGSTADEVLRGN